MPTRQYNMPENLESPFTEAKFIQCAGTIYQALRQAGEINPRPSVSAIAAIRLIMVENLGFERQRELIAEWNDAPMRVGPSPRGMRLLAMKAIEYGFLQAGVPAQWVHRLDHLYQSMPPLDAELDTDELQLLEIRRDELERDGEWSNARITGNRLIAMALWQQDADAIERHSRRNLEILQKWKDEDPELGREYEFEEHEWTIANAKNLAEWAARARHHI